jgi:2-polyprenyl-6-methoxyphenol hydroxylase-like FAD-dependent oxidoreductase
MLALNLARHSIPVEVLEAAGEADESLRAALHSAPGVQEMRRVGILDDVRKEGYLPQRFTYRTLDTTIASLDGNDLPQDFPDRWTCLPVSKVCQILRTHLGRHSLARIRYYHPVTGLGQDEEKAWVEVAAPGGGCRIEADYIVGCDGAKSIVRRSLFGERVFPGRSWNVQIVTTNVRHHLPSWRRS